MKKFAALIFAAVGLLVSPAVAGDFYVHVNTNATTVVKPAPGNLVSVCVNKLGASANTATIYDNTAGSGTVIAVIDTVGTGPACKNYNLAFTTGLTVVTATGTAADLTVTFQ